MSLIADLFVGYRGYREERHSGRWIWAKFFAALAFAALEASLILVPMLLPFGGRFFLPVFLTCTVIALANFAWFLPLMRRWKLPGRALEAPENTPGPPQFRR